MHKYINIISNLAVQGLHVSMLPALYLLAYNFNQVGISGALQILYIPCYQKATYNQYVRTCYRALADINILTINLWASITPVIR